MEKLISYLIESVSKNTSSNFQRKKELESWLKNKNYPDHLNALNRMLKDPKAKLLLQDGFGGDLGNMKLKYSVKQISANSLRPTQSEIDIEKSIKHGLTKLECVKKDFFIPVIINNMPLITFRGNYIIDGHHRWAEVMAFNPNAKMTCFDYDGEISPIQMLKAVQGAIAAVLADEDSESKIPSSIVNDKDIFKMSYYDIKSYIEENIDDKVKSYLISKLNSSENVIDYITDNIENMKTSNYPESGMPNRGEMPQTDKAGTDKHDKTTSTPDSKGSALHKLKTGKIDKDAIA